MATPFLRDCFDIACIAAFILAVLVVADAVAHSPIIVWQQ